MEAKEFLSLRSRLQKTQKEISQLLGISLRAVQSFEQGWRKVPVHTERQLLFLWSLKIRKAGRVNPCWTIRKCPPQVRQDCPAWEFRAGQMCWFMNGTICRGKAQTTWASKMKMCRICRVFAATMKF